ncbi:MAG: metal ABC transporter substrate-binding protein, partial [Candidatus Hodarchaeota archaeon]
MTSKWSFKWDKMFFLIILFLGCFSSPLISYELFFPIQASNKVPTIPLEKPIARSPNGVKIVASISIAGDFVQKVVGDLATVSTIVSGLENPHTFEPTSGDIDTIATCDLFVKMGVPGLESWVDDITAAYPDITTVEACNLATMMEYDSIIGAKNPHVWMSPLIAKEMVERIYTEVIT